LIDIPSNILNIIQNIFSLLFLSVPLGYTIKKIFYNHLFRKSKIEGFHLSKRYFDSSNDPIIELIRIRSNFINIIGETVYYFKNQNYELDLKFSKQHSSVISGTWKNKNDPHHYGEFAWNFNYYSSESRGYWSATKRDGLIEFGRWELKKIDKNTEAILNSRLFKKMITKKKSSLYDNILQKHDKEPEKPFGFNGRNYNIMKNVFNPQFGKIGRPLIIYLLDKYDLSQFKNIIDWGTGCGYYCIEIAFKQKMLNIESKIIALESDETTIQCANDNIMKFLKKEEEIKLIWANRISSNAFDVKFDLIIANMPFSKPCYLVDYRRHPMYHCFCSPPELILEICFEIKNALNNNGIALLSYADSGDKEFLFACLKILDMNVIELFRVDKEDGATDDIFYAYEIKNK